MISKQFENELDELEYPTPEQFEREVRNDRTYQNLGFSSYKEYKELIKHLVQKDNFERSLKENEAIQARNKALNEYNESENQIIERFKEALFKKNGVSRHSPRADFLWNKCWESRYAPRADILWNKCWEPGHSSGLDAVETMFDEWAPMLHL